MEKKKEIETQLKELEYSLNFKKFINNKIKYYKPQWNYFKHDLSVLLLHLYDMLHNVPYISYISPYWKAAVSSVKQILSPLCISSFS